MASTISPNMNLIIPTVGSQPGPDFALNVNSSLTLIDQHDHSPGKGVQITPAGLNINTDLDFNGHAGINIADIVLIPQPSAITTNYAISAAPGGGAGINDLWFTDGTGVPIQITKDGQVNVVAASIPGESYSAGTFIWTQTQSSLPTTPANFDIGSITIRPNVAATTNGVTISPPSGISSAYSFVLPLLPSVTSFLTITNSGTVNSNIPYPISAQGDLLVGTSGASLARLGVGSNGQVLTADSTAPNGLSYQNATNGVISTKTSNYTITSADSTIIADATSGSFTLTLPAASSVPNQKFFIKRQDAVIANIVTISGTIDGASDWVLFTENEVLGIQSNGTAFTQIQHDTESPTYIDTNVIVSTGSFAVTTWDFTIAAASVTTGAVYADSNGTQFTAKQTITGGTSLDMSGWPYPASAPGTLTKLSGTGAATLSYSAFTFVSGTSIRDWRWHREGNEMVGQLLITQTTVGGTGGSGTYELTIPNGQTIDTSITPINNGTNAFAAWPQSALSSEGVVSIDGGSLVPQTVGQFCVFSATQVRFIGVFYNNTNTMVNSAIAWQSGTSSLTGIPLYVNISFRIPILGWKP